VIPHTQYTGWRDNDFNVHAYLKDWNFTKENPAYGLYNCPGYFREDWLNEHDDADGSASDHRLAIGGKIIKRRPPSARAQSKL
jgi:hypothetical protein